MGTIVVCQFALKALDLLDFMKNVFFNYVTKKINDFWIFKSICHPLYVAHQNTPPPFPKPYFFIRFMHREPIWCVDSHSVRFQSFGIKKQNARTLDKPRVWQILSVLAERE